MYISLNNWMVGAAVSVNTASAVNAAGMVGQVGVDPVAIPDVTGTLGYSLGAVRRVRCWGLFDYRGLSRNITLRLRNGGAAGAIVHTTVVGMNFGTYGSTGNHPANEFSSAIFDVNADYLELSVTSLGGLANYTQIGRIWVGDALPCRKADGLQLSIVDMTTIEASGTGEEFFTENKGSYEVSVARIVLEDYLATGAASVDGDYEDFIDDLTVGYRECAVFAQEELLYAFHGRVASASIQKDAGTNFSVTSFNLKGF